MTGEDVPDAREEWNGEDPECETQVEAGRESSEVVLLEVRKAADGCHGEGDCGQDAEEGVAVWLVSAVVQRGWMYVYKREV